MARILTSYYKPKPGGLCTRYFRSINALLARGHTVHYLAVERFPISHPSCHFHRFPWPQHRANGLLFWFLFHMLAPLQLLYIGIRYRVERAYAFAPTYGFALQLVRALLGVRLSVFLRGDAIRALEVNGHSETVVRAQKLIEGLSIANASIVAVSHTLKNTVLGRHNYRSSHVVVIPNSIDGNVVERETILHFPIRFSCVGIIEPSKNFSLAIRALSGIQHKSFELHFFGSGPEEKNLKELCRGLGLSKATHFHGWVERSQIWDSTDVMLFPSLHEGCPNAVLEAMQHDVLVIAGNTPEMAEVLPQDNLLPLTDTVWRAHIDKLLSQPVEFEKGITRQRVKREKFRFDWDTQVSDTIATSS